MAILTEARLLFLGTGGSMGVPVVGCPCLVCHSALSYNKRLRPSVLIKWAGKLILVDCGPDFRLQALKYGINYLDGAIITHAHHDHTAGIDELRIFTLRSGQPLPCLLSEESLNELKTRFYYIFYPQLSPEGTKLTTNLALHCLKDCCGETNFLGLKIRYLSYFQGGMKVTGFRFGNLAYLTDIKDYNEGIYQELRGVKTLIISALRYTPSYLHFTVDDAINFAHKVGAEQTWITHIAHELEHERTNVYLPDSMHLSYDGLEIHFDAELA